MPIDVFSRVKDGDLKIINENSNLCNIKFNGKKSESKYVINKLWKKESSNHDVFHDLINRSQKYNQCYWCSFGYTGSGKTYTTVGILRLLLEYYLKHGENINFTGYQIYNEKIYDIMNDNSPVKIWKTNNLQIENLKKINVVNSEDIIKTIQELRTQNSTEMNKQSSRSHAFFSVSVGSKTINLVDMAGQENGNTNMNNNNKIQKEGTKINLNMLVVKECIRAYHNNKPFIPFRRCLLTLALKPIFFGNCYTAFICTVSCNHNEYYQMDSIRFASALYKPYVNNDDKFCNELFQDYTKYLEDMANFTFSEHNEWKKLKFGHFKSYKRIENLVNYKIKKIQNFKNKYDTYKDKLPKI